MTHSGDVVARGSSLAALLRASHPGPTVAVTFMVGLFAIAVGVDGVRLGLVTAAVLTGQLTIGWSNDLIDARRDSQVGRRDKPLATGELSTTTAWTACAVALVATVTTSLACGLAAGLVQLACTAAGWAYNVGMKSTVWSWLPYAIAFGGLPVFVSLTHGASALPPAWIPVAGALLGVGAHLVNVLPDLADDAATGVRGLPHLLGARWTAPVAVVVLAAATGVIAVGSPLRWPWVTGTSLVVVGALAVWALTSRGRTPFRAALGIALVDVAMLAWSQGGP